jgi:hypothetical protein
VIFRSETVSAQWDTWCYFHKGTYYLYYLITEHSCGEGFGVAASDDGVHWLDHGWAISASDQMVHFLGTGSVWPDPCKASSFLCNYSEHRLDEQGKQRQCILFAGSDDLIHWTKLGDEHICWIDERYYERYGRWDCIYAIPQPDGSIFGTWTATPKGRKDQNGGIGFGVSSDGIHWQALLPADIYPDADESGAMIEIDGRVHAMFGHFGKQLPAGMHAYVADSPRGPFRLGQKNSQLLKAWHTYFSRFFTTPEGILVNHHSMDGKRNEYDRLITYLAPFKKLSIDDEGVQRWVWWTGNEDLKGPELQLGEEGDFQAGIVLEGSLRLTDQDHFELCFDVDSSLYVIHVFDKGIIEFLKFDSEQNSWSSLMKADRQLPSIEDYTFRILARRGMAEVYLNDHFMECCILGCPDARIIRYTDPGQETDNLRSCTRMWRMSL